MLNNVRQGREQVATCPDECFNHRAARVDNYHIQMCICCVLWSLRNIWAAQMFMWKIISLDVNQVFLLYCLFIFIYHVYGTSYNSVLWSHKCACSFGVLRPFWTFFTHMETPPLPVKSFNFWLIFGTHGHWVVTFL